MEERVQVDLNKQGVICHCELKQYTWVGFYVFPQALSCIVSDPYNVCHVVMNQITHSEAWFNIFVAEFSTVH